MLFTSSTTRGDGWLVVSVSGDCDLASAPALRRALAEAAGRADRLAVDLRGVSFLDSVGLGLLIGAARRATAFVVVAEADDPARRVLAATRVEEILDVRDALPQA